MAEQTFSIFTTVLSYSIFIICAPISTFFITKLVIFEGIFNVDSVSTNVWSAVAAIIVLHFALGLYIYKAYSTGKDIPEKPIKVD